ncbi:MAG: hypothetical protein A3F10_06205 [Coxiella sp. RIFCSPHIGHO2_12_FULL_42_15]|nr:MAG: hypothetical protein A3F10_06205 [Coxiella sp. RIFCSPHIGHO2_12_FULL_42_15]
METRIVTQADLATFELLHTKHFTLGYYSQKHPQKIKVNEDTLGLMIDGKQCFLAVADGVGGSPNGEIASQLAISNLIHSLKKGEKLSTDLSHFRQPVLTSIETSNEKLIHEYVGARTTLTSCIIIDDILQSIQIGDSCLINCGQKGLLKHKTLEHSPVGFAVAAGLLTEKQAITHPGRHIVANVVGDPDMHMDIGPRYRLAEHDTILLGSDGLFDNFLIETLIEIIRKETMEEVMTKLTQACQPMRDENKLDKFHKLDDVSFIVCRLVK